jgi:hypothetical protein
MHGREKNTKVFPENVSEVDYMEHRGIKWTIIIIILNKEYGRME